MTTTRTSRGVILLVVAVVAGVWGRVDVVDEIVRTVSVFGEDGKVRWPDYDELTRLFDDSDILTSLADSASFSFEDELQTKKLCLSHVSDRLCLFSSLPS